MGYAVYQMLSFLEVIAVFKGGVVVVYQVLYCCRFKELLSFYWVIVVFLKLFAVVCQMVYFLQVIVVFTEGVVSRENKGEAIIRQQNCTLYHFLLSDTHCEKGK